MAEEEFKLENKFIFIIGPEGTVKLDTIRPSDPIYAVKALQKFSGRKESELKSCVEEMLSLSSKKVYSFNDDVSDIVYDVVGDAYDGDGIYKVRFHSPRSTSFKFHLYDQCELAEYAMFFMIAAGLVPSTVVGVNHYFRGNLFEDLSKRHVYETLMTTVEFANGTEVSLIPQFEDAIIIVGRTYPRKDLGIVYIDSEQFGTVVRWKRSTVLTCGKRIEDGDWYIVLDRVEKDAIDSNGLDEYLVKHYQKVYNENKEYDEDDDETFNSMFMPKCGCCQNRKDKETEDDEYDEYDDEGDYEEEYEDECEDGDEDDEAGEEVNLYNAEAKFSWVLGKFDNESVEIMADGKSVELIPLNRYTIHSKITYDGMPNDELIRARNIQMELAGFEVGKLMPMNKMITGKVLSSALKPLADEDDNYANVYTVRFNQGESTEFQFFAADGTTLAGYVMSFVIAAGLGKVNDVTHYYRNKKVKKFTSHSWNKVFVTVISFKDGRQMVVFEGNECFYAMLGRVKVDDDKFMVQYGEDVDIFYWKIDKTSGRDEINIMNVGEWFDETDFI